MKFKIGDRIRIARHMFLIDRGEVGIIVGSNTDIFTDLYNVDTTEGSFLIPERYLELYFNEEYMVDV